MHNKPQERNDCISSARVEGTSVYGVNGDKIGSVDCVMIEKKSGQAREAIVDVGSFLGMGGTRHTIPWQKLEYNEDSGGYKLDITEEQLKNAPSYPNNEKEERSSDPDYKSTVYEFYSVPSYW